MEPLAGRHLSHLSVFGLYHCRLLKRKTDEYSLMYIITAAQKATIPFDSALYVYFLEYKVKFLSFLFQSHFRYFFRHQY